MRFDWEKKRKGIGIYSFELLAFSSLFHGTFQDFDNSEAGDEEENDDT
jgi:hypothetical protein